MHRRGLDGTPRRLLVTATLAVLVGCGTAATPIPAAVLPHVDPALESVLPRSANGIAFEAAGSTDGEDGIGNEGLYGGIFPAIIDTIGIDHAADLHLADETQEAPNGLLVVRVFRLTSLDPARTWPAVFAAAERGPSQAGLTTWHRRTLPDRAVLVSDSTDPSDPTETVVEVVQRGDLLWEVAGSDASLVERIAAALP